ncbi:MAG: o-succinylbenzoate synthase [Gemmatimonadetes bacterium]|nr:o-succinylbenzoate synthase [Gemmatimonadota bacterium]
MKIERAVLREIRLNLLERFEISSGGRQDRRILLLTMEGEGEVGWGECVAGEDPGYSYETTETAWHVLTEFLLPAVVGSEIEAPSDVLRAAPWVRGHRMAKAGMEMTAWDLAAKIRGVSLATLLQGTRDRVAVGVSVGLQPTDDDLFQRVEGYLEEGYRKVKIKIKPGRDVEMLTGLRQRFPEAELMADANSAYSLADLDRLRAMDGLRLMMIEQPLAHDDYLDHASLQEQMETPICLDESIRSVGDAALALKLGSCRIINIKPGRVGGFTSSRAIHDVSVKKTIPVWCGGMLESGIGRAHNLHLATIPNFKFPNDISASKRYYSQDLIEPPIDIKEDGTITVPEGAGIGVFPQDDRIKRATLQHEIFK